MRGIRLCFRGFLFQSFVVLGGNEVVMRWM